MKLFIGSSGSGLGRTPVVGILSTTTTGTASAAGGIMNQSSLLAANQSSGHMTSSVDAAAGPGRNSVNPLQQQQAVGSGHAKKPAGPRNLSVTFDPSQEPPVEWRAKFGLLSKRKMSLPHSVKMNTRGTRSADAAGPLMKSKPLKV